MANLQAPSKWFYIGIITIISGFVFLRIPPVDGFFTMTLAPIFLVVGFLIFIPLGLYPSIKNENRSEFRLKNPDEKVYANKFGFVVFLLVWAVYINTMWPAPGWWGSAEYINGAYNLIIQSPPGSVILQITGRLFSFLGFIDNPAVRINFMIATASATAITILYYTIIRILRRLVTDYNNDFLIIVPSALASITFAFTESVWNKATFTNPYALSLLTASILIYLAVRWWEDADEPGAGNYLLLSAFMFGLDLSIHRSNLLLVPAFFFMVLIRKPKTFLDFRIWIGGVALLFLGFSLQLFNMFRAQLDPLINFNNPSSWQGLWDYLTLTQYNIKTFGSDLLQRKGPFWETQIKYEYLRYLGWNFIGMDSQGENIKWTGMYGIPLFIGLIGMVYSFIKKFKTALFILSMFFVASMGAIIYLNVPENFFRPMDRHYLPSFMLFAVWIGIGCYGIMVVIDKITKSHRVVSMLVLILLVFLLPLNMLNANWTNNNQSQNYTAHSYSYNLLQSCDENAIFVCAGDNDTFLCWYLQQVEKIRQDVITINWGLMCTAWYPETMKSHYPDTPFDIDSDTYMAGYPIAWESDSVTIAGESDTLTYFLEPTFNDQYLLPNDVRFIEVLKENQWERPICFSSGFGHSVPLNLQDYTQLCGLVFHLQTKHNDSLEIDYEKYENLIDNVLTYKGYGATKSLDRVNHKMEFTYLNLFAELAIHYKQAEENEKLNDLLNRYERHWPNSFSHLKQYVDGYGDGGKETEE